VETYDGEVGWPVIIDDIYSEDGVHCSGPELGCLGCTGTTITWFIGYGAFIVALCCVDCMEPLVRMRV